MAKAIVIEALKGLPKPDKLKSHRPEMDEGDESDAEGDQAARLSALEEFFSKGRKGDFEGADAAFAEYRQLCTDADEE